MGSLAFQLVNALPPAGRRCQRRPGRPIAGWSVGPDPVNVDFRIESRRRFARNDADRAASDPAPTRSPAGCWDAVIETNLTGVFIKQERAEKLAQQISNLGILARVISR